MREYAGDAVLESARLEERRQARSVSPEPRSTASITSRGSSQAPKVVKVSSARIFTYLIT